MTFLNDEFLKLVKDFRVVQLPPLRANFVVHRTPKGLVRDVY